MTRRGRSNRAYKSGSGKEQGCYGLWVLTTQSTRYLNRIGGVHGLSAPCGNLSASSNHCFVTPHLDF